MKVKLAYCVYSLIKWWPPEGQDSAVHPLAWLPGTAPAWEAQSKHRLNMGMKRSPMRLPCTAYQSTGVKVLIESWNNAQAFQALFTGDLLRYGPWSAEFTSQGLRLSSLEERLFHSCFSPFLPTTSSCSSEMKHATQQWRDFPH